MTTALSFVIVLGLLIFVHELGHFIFAKLFRVRVDKFSLGFGPKLLGRRIGETEYVISALPLGGYVRMLGENPGEDVEAVDRPRSFAFKPIWARFIIVFGGPAFNLLFAVLVYFFIFAFAGQPFIGTRIGEVQADSAAAEAGLQQGDHIQAIDGLATDRWEQVSEYIREHGEKPIALRVERNGKVIEITAVPRLEEKPNLFGEKTKVPVLGISATTEIAIEKLSIGQAFAESLRRTWEVIYLTILGLVKIIQNVIPASTLGGPILIAQMAGQQLEAGWINLFYFIGLLSVNLGILNLLPIPILDGGHLLFFTFEALMRKPLSLRTREILQQVGLLILAALMFFVFYNDLARVFSQG